MKLSIILEHELRKSHQEGCVTDNLLNILEVMIYDHAQRKRKSFKQSDELNNDMVNHSINMYESRLAAHLVDMFYTREDKGLNGTELLSYIRKNVGCTFANFMVKRHKGEA